MAEHGAGEILLTSMDRDGNADRLRPRLRRAVSDAGALEHLSEGIRVGGADAVLATRASSTTAVHRQPGTLWRATASRPPALAGALKPDRDPLGCTEGREPALREVRIIGGQWKRLLPVADKFGLRPTPGSVARDALQLAGRASLDGWRVPRCFAGLGALGFEVASRGAAEVLLLSGLAASGQLPLEPVARASSRRVR